MSELREIKCVPCSDGVPKLSEEERGTLLTEISGWQIVEDHHLKKRYSFADFSAALEFVNRVGQVAENEGHHPDISFGWGYAEISIWTHKIDGLSQNDFILAAKIDSI